MSIISDQCQTYLFEKKSIDPDFMDWKCHFDATNQFCKKKWDNCKNIKHTMFWSISIKVQNKIETQIRIKIAVEVQRPQLRNLLWNLVLSMPYLHIYFIYLLWSDGMGKPLYTMTNTYSWFKFVWMNTW